MRTPLLLLGLTLMLALAPTAMAGTDMKIKLGLAEEKHDLQVIHHGDASISVFVDGELVTLDDVLP